MPRPTVYYPIPRPPQGGDFGATFTVFLPAAEAEAPAAEQKTTVTAHTSAERTLISQSWGPLSPPLAVAEIEYKTFVEAHDELRKYGASYKLSIVTEAPTLDDYKTFVKAHTYLEPQQISRGKLDATTAAPTFYDYKTYVDAHRFPEPHTISRSKLDVPDLQPPNIFTTIVKAYDEILKYGAT